MATLAHLVATGKLVKHEADLERDEQPQRVVCFSPKFNTKLESSFQGMARLQGRNRTPYEQIEQILYDFIIGRPMAYGSQYHPLDPLVSHTWELKTPDVRLIGWFPQRGHFVVVEGELKDNLKKFADYSPHVQKTVAFRDALDLDEPKAITGVSRNDVL
jgi:hypothetical protein